MKGAKEEGMKGSKEQHSDDSGQLEKTYLTFEELEIWNVGMEICYSIYDNMRSCHDFGLKNQMERSSVSIPSNISEGYELSSDRAFIRHLYIAKGSCAELRTQLYIANRQKYISPEVGLQLINRTKVLSGMIQKFIEARKKRLIRAALKFVFSFLY